MSVIHPSIATARWRKDAILFFTEDDENSSSPFFGTGQNETSWGFPPPAEQNRFVSPFPIHSSFGTKVPLLPSPSFHVWHFKLNPPKKRRRREFFFGGCDRSCDANEDDDDDDIEWNSGGGDGKRKDAEVAKWDEGEGSEGKKVGAWASSSSSSRPVSFAHFVTCPLLTFAKAAWE